MGERPISALFGLFADWCVANGHTDMAKRVDCPSFKIEDWTFTLNPSRDERKHGDITVPPYTLLVTNPEGWPGLCGPFGGAMMWGDEDRAIAALERAKGSRCSLTPGAVPCVEDTSGLNETHCRNTK